MTSIDRARNHTEYVYAWQNASSRYTKSANLRTVMDPSSEQHDVWRNVPDILPLDTCTSVLSVYGIAYILPICLYTYVCMHMHLYIHILLLTECTIQAN